MPDEPKPATEQQVNERAERKKQREDAKIQQEATAKANRDMAQAQALTALQNELDNQRQQTDDTRRQLDAALTRLTAIEINHPAGDPNAPQQQFNGESLFAAGSAIKPAIFTGGYNPTATEWFDRFEEIAIAHKWQGNRRAELVQLFLDGGARLVYRALPDDIKSDYTQLRTQLIKLLEPAESPRFFSQLLYGPKARKLREGEYVAGYAADIQKYVQGAHPVTDEFSAGAQKQIMREAFIGGLPPDMRNAVMDKDPNNFDEALLATNKIEARNYLIRGEAPVPLSQPRSHQTLSINASHSYPNRNFQPQYRQRSPQNEWPSRSYSRPRRDSFDRDNSYRRPSFNRDNYDSNRESSYRRPPFNRNTYDTRRGDSPRRNYQSNNYRNSTNRYDSKKYWCTLHRWCTH
ncbi:MAG: hypothetical protein GY696_18370, partial [Gammaproteobacteria bacterium]|nr:hypothetical protein [Gammaproteobacteria bacterium]